MQRKAKQTMGFHVKRLDLLTIILCKPFKRFLNVSTSDLAQNVLAWLGTFPKLPSPDYCQVQLSPSQLLCCSHTEGKMQLFRQMVNTILDLRSIPSSGSGALPPILLGTNTVSMSVPISEKALLTLSSPTLICAKTWVSQGSSNRGRGLPTIKQEIRSCNSSFCFSEF